MSGHLTSCYVLSRLVISCHVMSCHIMSCHVMSRLVLSCLVLSCLVLSCLVLSCHVTSCHVMSCHVISRLPTSCHVLFISSHLARESCSRIFLPSLLNSSMTAAGWPRRGKRNRGPVRESGSERRSRCSAARTASVCVGLVRIFATWASFCVAGCGDRACCERARVAPCTFLRPGHRFAWQAVGIGRVGGVPRVSVAGMPRACRGHAAGALRWGLGSGRVAHAHDFTRCDLRFAWHVWEFGCIDALGKALDGGSAWQAQ